MTGLRIIYPISSKRFWPTPRTAIAELKATRGVTLMSHAVYAVEDRTPRVYPWMNEFYLVSASAEVRSAPQEP
jgi:hypothetical protein